MGNPSIGTFTNSEDPDEMPHLAEFHQGLHFLLKSKRSLDQNISFFLNRTSHPKIYNGPSQLNCIRIEGRTHLYTKD